MSDTENKDGEVQEKKNKIVVSPEDCFAGLDFWKHFNIPIPAALEQAMNDFKENQTFENQQRIKLELCRAISQTDHDAFKDEMFQKIIVETESVTYDMQFERDLEDTLTVPKEESQTKE